MIKKRKGETLIEIIIAMGILTIGAFIGGTLITDSLRSTVVNKNYLLAVNLSREGIEAVRAIRDTNWLVFPHNTKDCWDVVDDELVTPSTCGTSNKFTTQTYYRVNLKAAADASPYKWVLEPAGDDSAFTPATSTEDRKFYLLAPDSSNANFYRHQADTGTQEYATDGTSFYRAITIEDVDGAEDKVRVTSTINWLERGEFNEMLTESILTNYQ